MSVERRDSWFDDAVDSYERARPAYPDDLFDDLVRYLRAGGQGAQGASVLEIGSGTGKATASLLDRGMIVTGVEPGENMSRFLRRKFSDDSRFRVMHGRLEDVSLAADAFDAVVSATALHWVDPSVRLVKTQRVLREGGVLAVVDTNQIASTVDRDFFERCFPIYLRYRPDEQRTELPGADITPSVLEEIVGSSMFASQQLHRYRWDQTYSTAAYADLVRSYSNTQMMSPESREGLITDLCALIDKEFDGYVVRPLVISLVLARKRTL